MLGSEPGPTTALLGGGHRGGVITCGDQCCLLLCEKCFNLPPESSPEEQKLVVSSWLLC